MKIIIRKSLSGLKWDFLEKKKSRKWWEFTETREHYVQRREDPVFIWTCGHPVLPERF